MEDSKNKPRKTTKAQAAAVLALGVELMRDVPDSVTRAVHGDEVADLVEAAFGKRQPEKNSSAEPEKLTFENGGDSR